MTLIFIINHSLQVSKMEKNQYVHPGGLSVNYSVYIQWNILKLLKTKWNYIYVNMEDTKNMVKMRAIQNYV